MENIRILAVDDSTTNIALLAGILEEEGYEVIKASNGKDALKLLLKEHIDLILLDLMMPKIDGYKILEKLKQMDNKKNIPVVVVSARTNTKSIKKALDMGAFDFIKKPVDIVELLSAVNKALNKPKI